MLVFPALPDLVVTMMTPLAPREPYIAVDDASFNMSIVSMSLGAISEIELTGKPSTIYNGELSWVMEPPPLTLTVSSASGDPSVLDIFNPATRPWIASRAEDTGAALMV